MAFILVGLQLPNTSYHWAPLPSLMSATDLNKPVACCNRIT